MQAKNQLETAVSELKAAAAKSASLKIKAPSQLPQPAAGRTSITAPTLQPPIANRSVSLGTAASGQKEVGSKRTFSEAYTASNGGGAPAIPSSPLKHKTPRHSTAADGKILIFCAG
jgi:hypothetical protein